MGPSVAAEGNFAIPAYPISPYDWIDENVHEDSNSRCSGSGCLDPTGTDVRNRTDDLAALPHIGNFSGFTCNHYAKYFCKNGRPDLENHADMFGIQFNWPELNCCACGGGDLGVIDDNNKHKYEYLNGTFEDDDINNFNLTSACEPEEINQCIEQCNNSSKCLGLSFTITDHFDQDNLDEAIDVSLYHGGSNEAQFGQPSQIKFIHKVSADGSNEIPDYEPEELISLINRNNLYKTNINRSSGKKKILKKLPLNYQNTVNGNISSESGSGVRNHNLDYDKVIENNALKNHFTNCDELCSQLDGYKVKENKRNEICQDNCKRSECCELNNCYYDRNVDTICSYENNKMRDSSKNSILCGTPDDPDRPCTDKCCKSLILHPIPEIKVLLQNTPASSRFAIYSPNSDMTTSPTNSFKIMCNNNGKNRCGPGVNDNDLSIIFHDVSEGESIAQENGILCNTGCGYGTQATIQKNQQNSDGSGEFSLGGCTYSDPPRSKFNVSKCNAPAIGGNEEWGNGNGTTVTTARVAIGNSCDDDTRNQPSAHNDDATCWKWYDPDNGIICGINRNIGPWGGGQCSSNRLYGSGFNGINAQACWQRNSAGAFSSGGGSSGHPITWSGVPHNSECVIRSGQGSITDYPTSESSVTIPSGPPVGY